jgi:hypothetical protein
LRWLGKYVEASVIAALLMFNAALGFFQESRPGDSCCTEVAPGPDASIPRGGVWRTVPAVGLVGPKARHEPLWIHPADGALLLFAGLFEAWQPQPGEWRRTFTTITTAAKRKIEPIHDRMPIILD